MKQSISDIIMEYMQDKSDWIIKGKILDYVKSKRFGYESAMDRKCRLLADPLKHNGQPPLERKIERGLVYYRKSQSSPITINPIREKLDMIMDNPIEKIDNIISETFGKQERSMLDFNYRNDEK